MRIVVEDAQVIQVHLAGCAGVCATTGTDLHDLHSDLRSAVTCNDILENDTPAHVQETLSECVSRM